MGVAVTWQRVAVCLAALCLPSCTGTTQVAHSTLPPPPPSPNCSPQPFTGASGPAPQPLKIRLDHPTYHRIPTSVTRPAKVVVVFEGTSNVRILRAEAVIVRRGVDIGNGPFTHHIPMLRNRTADGQRVPVTLPATDSTGRPLPAGQYLWGVLADFVLTGPCPQDRALGQQRAGAEMPFLVVRPSSVVGG